MPDTLRTLAHEHNIMLVQKAQSGDHAAFGKLVAVWFKRIYHFSLNYFGEHDQAMEVSQKTFIAVFEKIRGLKNLESFHFWLYKIALNQCRVEDRAQSGKMRSSRGLDEILEVCDMDDDPETLLVRSEGAALIRNLLTRLPEEQRIVIIMKEFDELKFREIAELLAISENTVKSRLYYGLKKLKSIIEKNNLKTKLMH